MVLTSLLVALAGCGAPGPGPAPAPAPPADCSQDASLDWDSVGRPLLTTWCTPCHSSSLSETARSGAPEGLDLDTYASVVQWSEQILASAGTSDRMPPAGGMSDTERRLLSDWIPCGLPGGGPEPAEPCATLAPAPGDHPLDASLCRDYNALSGDLVVEGDASALSCLCSVEGELELSSAGGSVHLPLLSAVGGSVRLQGSSITTLDLPELRTVGGSLIVVDNPSLERLSLDHLRELGALTVTDNERLQRLDLSSVHRIHKGGLLIERNDQIEVIDLARLSHLEGDLVIALHPRLEQLNNLDAIEYIGGHLEIRDNAMSWMGEMPRLESLGGNLVLSGNSGLGVWVALGDTTTIGGGVQISGNPELEILSIGRSLQTVGGRLEIVDNASLSEIDPLPALTRIDDVLEIRGNPSLVALPGFASLGRAGGVIIEDLPSLESMGPFDVVQGITGEVRFVDLPLLSTIAPFPVVDVSGGVHVLRTGTDDLYALSRLQSAGSLTVDDNPRLVRLVGLAALEQTAGELALTNNPSLRQISALVGVSAVGGDLRIADNPSLPRTQVDLVTTAIGSGVAGAVDVHDNGP